MAAKNTLRDLYIEELRDVYDAENQLVKALPDMADAATSEELRTAFQEHLGQTKGHVERLESIFKQLDEKPTRKKCKGMEGLVAEGKEMIDGDFEGDVMDAGLISAAQRVEHYEIAAYGTLRAFATIMGEEQAVSLLEETLGEEKDADNKLTELAENINSGGADSESQEPDEEIKPSTARKAKAARQSNL